MQDPAGWSARFGDKDQLRYYLALLAVVVLALGLFVFAVLALIPAWRLTTALHADLALAQENLDIRERIQADAPRRAQQEVTQAETQLTAAAGRFLREETAGRALDRLYAYGAAAGVEVVDLQSQPVAGGEVFTLRSYTLRAVGAWDDLLDFLARLEEAALPGFVVGDLHIAPAADTADEAPPYALSMSLALYISPYAPVPQVAARVAVTGTAAPSTTDDLWLQLQAVWQNNDWASAVMLAEQLMALTPDAPAAGEALYRAYVNHGYHLLARRHVDAARTQFEAALQVKPDGQEAQLELQQIDANALAIFAAEERLARELATASTAGEWEEVIRLLRLIQTINPEYPDLDAQLRQAYLNYGDQLAVQGQTEAAEEQYQQADLIPAP